MLGMAATAGAGLLWSPFREFSATAYEPNRVILKLGDDLTLFVIDVAGVGFAAQKAVVDDRADDLRVPASSGQRLRNWRYRPPCRWLPISTADTHSLIAFCPSWFDFLLSRDGLTCYAQWW